MVWFQCDDCGENIKKPKLAIHFSRCGSYKFSCIDCGTTFDRQSVQGHTACITEEEKFGPKMNGKPLVEKKQKGGGKEEDTSYRQLGLSTHPPWKCSFCNVSANSQQALQSHAEGKKHGAKARASVRASAPTAEPEIVDTTKNGDVEIEKEKPINGDSAEKTEEELGKVGKVEGKATTVEENGEGKKRKRKEGKAGKEGGEKEIEKVKAEGIKGEEEKGEAGSLKGDGKVEGKESIEEGIGKGKGKKKNKKGGKAAKEAEGCEIEKAIVEEKAEKINGETEKRLGDSSEGDGKVENSEGKGRKGKKGKKKGGKVDKEAGGKEIEKAVVEEKAEVINGGMEKHLEDSSKGSSGKGKAKKRKAEESSDLKGGISEVLPQAINGKVEEVKSKKETEKGSQKKAKKGKERQKMRVKE